MDLFARDADYKTAQYAFYRYLPSEAAAIVFAVLFGIVTLFHWWKLFRTRTWFFIAFAIGGMFETVGYAVRAYQATQSPDWTLGPFIIQYLLILLAPSLFAASMYMMLGRIILMVDGEALSIVRRKWLTKIFVTGDVLSFLAQSAGGGIQASSSDSDNSKTGENVILIGLIIQIVFFGLFIVVAGVFNWRLIRSPTIKSTHTPWRSHMTTLYATNTLILIRCVFRAIEYGLGNNGYLLRHEVFLYVFDTALMFVVVCAYVAKYPNEISAVLKKERSGSGERSDVENGFVMIERGSH